MDYCSGRSDLLSPLAARFITFLVADNLLDSIGLPREPLMTDDSNGYDFPSLVSCFSSLACVLASLVAPLVQCTSVPFAARHSKGNPARGRERRREYVEEAEEKEEAAGRLWGTRGGKGVESLSLLGYGII